MANFRLSLAKTGPKPVEIVQSRKNRTGVVQLRPRSKTDDKIWAKFGRHRSKFGLAKIARFWSKSTKHWCGRTQPKPREIGRAWPRVIEIEQCRSKSNNFVELEAQIAPNLALCPKPSPQNLKLSLKCQRSGQSSIPAMSTESAVLSTCRPPLALSSAWLQRHCGAQVGISSHLASRSSAQDSGSLVISAEPRTSQTRPSLARAPPS